MTSREINSGDAHCLVRTTTASVVEANTLARRIIEARLDHTQSEVVNGAHY